MNKQEHAMSSSESAMVPPQSMPEENQSADGSDVVETRFGPVKIQRTNPIVFPNGMLGIPDRFEYCLTTFPSEKLEKFKLLQSLEDNDLSFITLPVAVDNGIIDKEDILTGCKDLEISESELTMLLIVTVHRQPDGVRLSVNARAPIFISTNKRVATQYVFHNNKYAIQHMITM
ncbi:MAG: flagellar assembly protein FliW [Rickettsiales bacterium]|nr:flagellar assembly protein FliW [Rickettsiales bacterium]